MRCFIKGLASDKLSEELALRERPETLAAASAALARLQAAERDWRMMNATGGWRKVSPSVL